MPAWRVWSVMEEPEEDVELVVIDGSCWTWWEGGTLTLCFNRSPSSLEPVVHAAKQIGVSERIWIPGIWLQWKSKHRTSQIFKWYKLVPVVTIQPTSDWLKGNQKCHIHANPQKQQVHSLFVLCLIHSVNNITIVIRSSNVNRSQCSSLYV